MDKEVDLRSTVCLVDEMDYLLSKDSSILYNFFSWPMQSQSGLIFIGVANTTNLPEVLTSRLQSRLDIHREVGPTVSISMAMYKCPNPSHPILPNCGRCSSRTATTKCF